MHPMSPGKPLGLFWLLSSIVLILAGCDSAARGSSLTLQLTRSTQVAHTACSQGAPSAPGQHVQPGDPGFLERLEIRVQDLQGEDLLTPQAFTLDASEQETMTRAVALPASTPPEFRVLVSAFNNFNGRQTELCRGETRIQHGQQHAVMTLVRNLDPRALVPIPATPSHLQQTVFTFPDGAAFGLSGVPVVLSVGAFEGNTGDFTLVAGAFMASGQVTIRSCDFVATVSTFPRGQGLQVGHRMRMDPCEVDALDRRLSVTNMSLSASSTSEPPASAPLTIPDSTITAPITEKTTILVGQAVTFQGTCMDLDNTTPLTALWTFGSGAPAVMGTNPGPVTFTTAGTFTVTFTCMDALGAADPTPATRTIVVGSELLFSIGAQVFKETAGGSPQLVLDEVALGLQPGSTLDALAVLADGSFLFSTDVGAQGVPGSAVEQARDTGFQAANIYRTTGDGTNTLFIAGDALGLLPNTNLDAFALLPDGSALFSVESSSRGVLGSAVAASSPEARASDIFRSVGNGTNTLFRSAAELGLTAGELTGLAWSADGTLVFSVAPNWRGVNSCVLPCQVDWELFCRGKEPELRPACLGQMWEALTRVAQVRGVPGSAVAVAAPETLERSVFLTASDGTNVLFRDQAALGIVSGRLGALATGPPPTADNQGLPPHVAITVPVPGQQVLDHDPLTIRFTVSDDVAVAALDVVVGGTTVKTIPFPGPGQVVSVPGPSSTGPLQLSALATDLGGATGTTTLTVTGLPDPPTVTITAPAIGATVMQGAMITISATATDNGRIDAVMLTVNGVTVLSTTTPPYSTSVSVPLGLTSLTIQATATDNFGQTAMALRTVQVIPDPQTTVVGLVVDPDGTPVQGATVNCLGVSGLTQAGGTFAVPGVPTVHGPIRCTVTVRTPQGGTLAATVPGVPPVLGGMTDVAQLQLVVVAQVGIVVDNTSQQAIVFDATTDIVVGTVALPAGFDTGDCSITPDGTRGFVSNIPGRAWVIDLITASPSLATGPNPILANPILDTSISPDGTFLVACDGAGDVPVSVIDIATQTQISSYSLGTDCIAVEVLHDSSVLVASMNGTIRRLIMDSAGHLTDTGERLASGGDPNNVFGAPRSTSGIIVHRAQGDIRSFTLPGLVLVDTRPLTGTFGVSGLIHPAGDRVYVRSNGNSGAIDVFAYNATTGQLSTAPLFSLPLANTSAFTGIDQMAITPDGAKLYVSQPNAVVVYDAHTGDLLRSMTHAAIVTPKGVCFAR
jgi:Bacterial Ig domain/PKD domain